MKEIDFAILAPVPKRHLLSGKAVPPSKVYVSFGSQKWELFRKVDKLRDGQDVPVLIYASHETAKAKFSFRVTWSASYVGGVEDEASKIEDAATARRPPTTYDQEGDYPNDWAVFWRVRHLKELPDKLHVQIKSLKQYKSQYWTMKNPPLGPEIVSRPAWI
jgi:hypothetical protein